MEPIFKMQNKKLQIKGKFKINVKQHAMVLEQHEFQPLHVILGRSYKFADLYCIDKQLNLTRYL